MRIIISCREIDNKRERKKKIRGGDKRMMK